MAKRRGGQGRRGGGRGSGGGGGRQYPRTARLNELLREVIASELERRDDDRLVHVAITGVDVDAELTLAKVYFDTLDASEASDHDATVALNELAPSLRKSLADETRLRRSPKLIFTVDPAVRATDRLEDVLGELDSTSSVAMDPDLYGARRAAPSPDALPEASSMAPDSNSDPASDTDSDRDSGGEAGTEETSA